MKSIKTLTTAFLAAVVGGGMITQPAHATVTARSVPPASFLDYHVDTVPQLTFEVTYDKAVQARLAHHFHLTGPEMSRYVHDNLVLQHLRAPLRTRVYCISPRRREYFVMMTLKTGTPVFALRRTGQPILRLVCGNPLVAALPPTPKKVLAAKPVEKTLAKTLVKSADAERITPVLPDASVTPAAWSVPTITTSEAGEALFTQAASSASGAGWLALLPVFGGLFGVIDSHPGSGGTSSGVPTITGLHTTLVPLTPSTPLIPSTPGTPSMPTDGPVPVPEVGSPWVFALGGLTLVALRLRRK